MRVAVRVMVNAVPHTLFYRTLSYLQLIFFYSFLSWAFYLATILLYFVPLARCYPMLPLPSLVLYSSYMGAWMDVHTLYSNLHGINASR